MLAKVAGSVGLTPTNIVDISRVRTSAAIMPAAIPRALRKSPWPTTSANMFFGDASVGTATGLLVLGIQGASFQLPTSAAISAIASGTTNVVSFLETYV